MLCFIKQSLLFHVLFNLQDFTHIGIKLMGYTVVGQILSFFFYLLKITLLFFSNHEVSQQM